MRKVDTSLTTIEEKQWLDDIQHHALQHRQLIDAHETAFNSYTSYTPFVRKMKGDAQLDQHLLYLQQQSNAKPPLTPPRPQPIHMPAPKGKQSAPTLHNTTWKYIGIIDWIHINTGEWNTPLFTYTTPCINTTTS